MTELTDDEFDFYFDIEVKIDELKKEIERLKQVPANDYLQDKTKRDEIESLEMRIVELKKRRFIEPQEQKNEISSFGKTKKQTDQSGLSAERWIVRA